MTFMPMFSVCKLMITAVGVVKIKINEEFKEGCGVC